MVIPSSEKHTAILTSKDLTLARIPNFDIAHSLKKTVPLLTSSANISGLKGSITAEGIALDFPSLEILGPIPWDISSESQYYNILEEKWLLDADKEGDVSVGELH